MGIFGHFWIFFQNSKTVLESKQAHLGGQRKEKKFDHSFCLQKDVFWMFPILSVKGVFFGFFLDFFQNSKPVLESEKEKNDLTTPSAVFWIYPILGIKGVFFGFFLDFFKIRKLF